MPEHALDGFTDHQRKVATYLTYGNKHIVPAMQMIVQEIMRLGSIEMLCGKGTEHAHSPQVLAE